ncbi:MAG: WD40/YVTN/BNR-like repeat-containing protein, partial [Bacteroidales bacterium]
CGDTNTTVSKDGGKTFTVAQWDRGTGKTHVDHRVVWVDPLNGKHVLSGNDGGVSESWDGGDHWSQKNTINVQQFYDVSVDNEQPYNVMGGTQDNGAWIGPSQNRNQYGLYPSDWRYLPTGDAFYVVRDWWNPEYIYYESQFGGSSRMNLKTGETSGLAVRLTPEQTAAGEPALRYQWNAPIVLSPHNPGIVYIASQYVWRSMSRGAQGTFVRISPDLTKADKTKLAEAKKTNLQWATVYTFSESPKKPGLYWAGTDDGNVQMSPDGGNAWVNITNQFYDAGGKPKAGVKGDLIPYDRWVKRVVASAFDEKTAYVAFSGYRTHNEDKTWLFVTHDSGKTWKDISGGLNNPVFDFEEDPDNANVLYFCGDFGIYVSTDAGQTWTPFSTSAPNTVIRDMAIQKRDREMAIATYGRGFYVADIGPIKEFKPEVFQETAHLFDIKDTIKWNRFEQRGDRLGEQPRTDNPPVGQSIYYYLKADAKNIKITIKDLEGNAVQEFNVPSAKAGLQKAFWNLARQAAGGQAAGGRGGRGGAAPPAAPGGAAPGAPAGGQQAVVNNPDQPPQDMPTMGRGRGANQVDPGVYKVTLSVDGKEIATKKMTVAPDPLFR